MTLFARLKLLFQIAFNRDLRNLYSIKNFGHANRDFLIIVCDPKTDRIFVSYRDRYVNGKIKSATGKKTHVVKGVIKYSRFNENIDSFIASIAETLNVSLLKGNQLYQILDGFLFNIAKSLRKKRGTAEKPTPPGSAIHSSPVVSEEEKK